ncbi:MAG: hypothetical protein OEZ35_07165 [Candidatus Bathyarchaeota archaeon]|nr:hypothetical protein [Candidatus Bathyarchaeota archaeon]
MTALTPKLLCSFHLLRLSEQLKRLGINTGFIVHCSLSFRGTRVCPEGFVGLDPSIGLNAKHAP